MSDPSTTAFDLSRMRDLDGRRRHAWYRRAGLVVLLAIVVAALLGVFGQREQTHTVTGDAGRLQVVLPDTVRGGLLWRTKITVTATKKIAAPQLVLGAGFVQGLQVNTLVPAPTSETSRGDGVAYTYPTLDAGDSLTVYLHFQTEPTMIGARDTSVSLEGANITPIRLDSSTRVLP